MCPPTDEPFEPPKSVWCTLCTSNLIGTQEKVVAHFRREHGRAPTADEIARTLSNTKKRVVQKVKKKKRKVFAMPSDKCVDPEVEHNARWKYVIQAGAPGLGKKK